MPASICAAPRAGAQEYTIKFATLATEGTTWMNVMQEYDAAIRKESGGRLGFKIYAGGVQGEDKDVMRKIRLGQLHSAGMTGVGLSARFARSCASWMPRSCSTTTQEVDNFQKVFENELDQEFVKNDFVLLGWAEVGFVYVLHQHAGAFGGGHERRQDVDLGRGRDCGSCIPRAGDQSDPALGGGRSDVAPDRPDQRRVYIAAGRGGACSGTPA